MHAQPCCLDCGATRSARLGPFTPEDRVWYYRCLDCGCVWVIDKFDATAPPRRVTHYALRPLPGDLVVEALSAGFLIAQISPTQTYWPEQVAVRPTMREAVQHAATIAHLMGGRAWRHVTGDEYEPIS